MTAAMFYASLQAWQRIELLDRLDQRLLHGRDTDVMGNEPFEALPPKVRQVLAKLFNLPYSEAA